MNDMQTEGVHGETTRCRATNVGLACEERYLGQAQPSGMLRALDRMGVPVLDTANGLHGCDVVVARGRSEAAIEVLERAEARGIPTVNSSGSVRNVVDKAIMHERLTLAGIPQPETWIGAWPALADGLAHLDHMLVVKPVRGDNSRDVHVLPNGAALAGLHFPYADAIVQRYLPNDGYDLKLYGIGRHVWAVRKPSPLRPDLGSAAALVATSPRHTTLGRRCARAVGLDLFGVDCIDTPHGLLVIEINDFPNYSGIDGADEMLAEFVLAQASTRTVIEVQ